MPSSLNSLLIAWTLTLIVLVGGFFYIESQYIATEASIEDTSGTSDDVSTTPDSEDQNISNVDPDPASGPERVTTLPRPEISDDTAQNGPPQNGGAYALAPGETAAKTEGEATGTSQTTAINPPNPDLLDNTRNGPLPRVSARGDLPAAYYAAPSSVTGDRPRIAVLITDLGAIERRTSRTLRDLNHPASLGFTPYAADLARWTNEARAKGLEYFLMVPMEPVNTAGNDPGPLGLLTDNTDQQNINLLQSALGQTTGYVGVVSHMGSRFTATESSMRPVLMEIQKRGLIFIDSRSTPYTRAASMAQTLNMRVLQNDRYVDNDLVEAEIVRQLGELENKARTVGAALGIARPYPVSIRAINSWAEGLDARGFDLVPVSALVGYQAIR